MEHAKSALHVSERRACRAIGQLRSSHRYVAKQDLNGERLRNRVVDRIFEASRPNGGNDPDQALSRMGLS